MSVAQLSQKEYLKKYLCSNTDDKKKKKKKKVQKSAQERFRIVDDDIDLKNMRPIDDGELDLYNLAEDAPQIAGIIDERPPEAQMLEEFRGTKRWKIIADENGTDEIKVTAIEGTSKKSLDSTEEAENSSSRTAKQRNPNNSSQRMAKKDSDSDVSPPRKSKVGSDSDPSPPRKTKTGSDSDISLPRRSRNVADSDASPTRKPKRSSDSDISPPRRSRRDSTERVTARKPPNTSNVDLSPPRKSRNASPPRNARKDTDSDISPPRKRARHSSSDTSPPRKPKRTLPADKNRGQRDISPHRRKRSSSPQRSRYDSDDINKHRRSETFVGKKTNSVRHSPASRRRHSDSDNSPPRRTSRKSITPPRKQKPGTQPSDHSRRRNGRSSLDNSPLQKGRMDKTLDGKRAGLQDANELKQELSDFKKREDELFSKMGDEVSGRGAVAVVRDRKTGKRKDLEQEAKQNEEEQRKKEIRNEKYSKWGRGLKQVEAQKENLEQALHEMSKPLARYADDQDLEKHLRDQEREGDPMLDYIRSKKTEDTTKKKPKYEGSYLPNRFGIPPGHRWDGVDRSNGYEKQWFEVQNAKKAREEEAYKWSTSDM